MNGADLEISKDTLEISCNNKTKNAKRNFSSKFAPKLRQFYVALGPTMITISVGMVEGFSGILLPQLENEKLMDIDVNLSSWIASIAALPMPIGCIFGGILMEIIGRKGIHMAVCFPSIIAWLIIYFSRTPTPLLIGRFISGFCVGLLGPPTPIYMAETSDPRFRGFLLAQIAFAVTFGVVLSHILGTFLTWQNVCLVGCFFPTTCLILIIFAPESPTYLAKKGKIDKAKEAFYWCRGRDENGEKELAEILDRQSTVSSQSKKTFAQYLRDLCKPEFVKPLAVMLWFFFTMQWAGSNALTFYNVSIIKQTMSGSIDEYTAMIIVDLIRLVASILTCPILNMTGRRPLAIFSCLGTIASLFTLSGFTYFMKFYPVLLEEYYYVLLIALSTYITFLTVGLVPLPWTMVGEVFPLSNRGIGSGISTLINYAYIFSVVKTTPFLFSNLGSDGTFLLFGIVCTVGFVLLAVFLPETRNKPLHEIEDYFKGNKK